MLIDTYDVQDLCWKIFSGNFKNFANLQFFLTVGENNFGNKIPLYISFFLDMEKPTETKRKKKDQEFNF